MDNHKIFRKLLRQLDGESVMDLDDVVMMLVKELNPDLGYPEIYADGTLTGEWILATDCDPYQQCRVLTADNKKWEKEEDKISDEVMLDDNGDYIIRTDNITKDIREKKGLIILDVLGCKIK